MNEMVIKATRTPEIIAGEIRTFTASMLNNVIEIGRRMVEVKELLPYGEFGKWITENTGYSSSTANNFMRLYQEYGADQGSLFGAEVDCQTFGKLSYSKALALLTVPKEERETVAVELDAEHLSTRELERAIRERDEARKAAAAADEERGFWEDKATEKALEVDKVTAERDAAREEARRAVEDAGPYKEQLAQAQKQIRELESRPVEVAVERDEEAIKKAADAARKAAEEKAAGDLDKLRKKLEAAEKAREKAEAQAKRADEGVGPYKEQAEQARAEAEALRKKLVSAESGANVVGTLFSLAQQNFNSALEKVVAMKATHPDVAEKLLAGMEQILGGLVEKVKGARG